jgi:chorismate mutase / prephenate dehydratase
MTANSSTQRLAALRAELLSADRTLVAALGMRARIVETIAALKAGSDAPVRDAERERDVLNHAAAAADAERLDPHLVQRIFRELLSHSVRTQQARLSRATESNQGDDRFVVGYQGAEGAYAHQAARRYFSPWFDAVTYQPFPTFRQLLQAVRAGEIQHAMLPVENTTAGSVTESYDLLAAMDLAIVGEEVQPIDHCLVGTAATPLRDIAVVYSHQQALAQCSEFLARMPWCRLEEFSNTALAARRVAEQVDPSHAAIASEEAARLLGLTILARDIANQRDNFTRFVVVADTPIEPPARVPCKTSVMFITRHERGALVTCLDEFARRQLNLTKIESRPRPGVPWEYQFYVDFEGHIGDPVVQEAVRAVSARAFLLKVFGSYVARTVPDAALAKM